MRDKFKKDCSRWQFYICDFCGYGRPDFSAYIDPRPAFLSSENMKQYLKIFKIIVSEGPIGIVSRLKVRIAHRLARKDGLAWTSKIAKTHPRANGLFIDCGSNLGQGFFFFEQHFPLESYDYVLVEPNPNCTPSLTKLIAELEHKNIELLSAAASTQEGSVSFFGLTEGLAGKTSQGASILKDHNSRFYESVEEQAIYVPTFSFSKLILEQSKKYKIIVVKIDIEGAEYEVLRDMLDNGASDHLSVIYVEFHSQYMTQPKRQVYQRREQELRREYRRRGVTFRLWI